MVIKVGSSATRQRSCHQDDKAQFYAFLDKIEADAFDALITDTILIRDQITIVLFDPGSTYFYMLV